jgi:outer membrane lipoprotein-sorting protein
MKRMKMVVVRTAVIGFLFVTAAAAHAVNSPELDKVLRQMDAVSEKFQSAQADFTWDQYEKVVDSHDIQTGTIYFQRKGGQTEMAAIVREMNGKPAPKDVIYTGGQLYLYQPNIDQLTIFSAGVNREQYESFLTLGFGSSGRDLEKNWDITYLGMEPVNGVQTAKLDLVGKQASVRANFKHITIWVDPVKDVSLKQQFFAPSDDMRTATYDHVQSPAKIPASVFKVKKAGNVVRH